MKKTVIAVIMLFQASFMMHSETVPASGLVGYWAGDGNANDSSSSANNGSFAGTYGTGIVGQAFLVSTGTYVTISDIPAYGFSTEFSVGFWYYGNSSGVFLGQDNGSGAQNKWFVDYGYVNPGKFEIHLNGPTSTTIASDAVTPASNSWHQFSLVKAGANYSFYFDGNAIGTQSNPGTFPDPIAPVTIGFAEPAVGVFSGLIDEVVLYNRALSVSEVQQLASVPEPSIWIMSVAGAGSMLFLRRHRN